MNFVKAIVIVIVLTMGAALVVLSAGAQQPTPLPHEHIAIPVTPPPGWVPKQWADLRTRCQEIADKAAAHQSFSRNDWTTAPICSSLATQPPPPPNGYPPNGYPSGAGAPMITPEATPSPAASDPQSALDPPVIGPFGTPFSGGSIDACTQGQPPDVAADVSPTQIVQLLNDAGLLVFNKQGQVLYSSGTSAIFWSALSPQPHLTDMFQPSSE